MLRGVDKTFLSITVLLIVLGLFIFISASLGVLAKNESKFVGILVNQLVLGLGAGTILAAIVLRAPIVFWKKNAFFLLIGAVVLSLLVFIPGLGFEHAGARRWVSLGPVSFQPAEFLKIALVLYAAGWFSWVRGKVGTPAVSLLPVIGMIGLAGALLLPQPDTKSVVLIAVSVLAIAFVAGMKWKHIFVIAGIGIATVVMLALMRPYVMDRIQTFLHPSNDTQGASYQVIQSQIAIGSGKLLGRGLGQSVQKFSYLPEPQGDSVFAVVGEEFGFIGSTLLIVLYTGFVLRGYHIAGRTKDIFSKYLVVGIITLIGAQSFMNIASIIGVFPLTGVPLVFVSHGGTSLMLSIGMAAMVLKISKSMEKVKHV